MATQCYEVVDTIFVYTNSQTSAIARHYSSATVNSAELFLSRILVSDSAVVATTNDINVYAPLESSAVFTENFRTKDTVKINADVLAKNEFHIHFTEFAQTDATVFDSVLQTNGDLFVSDTAVVSSAFTFESQCFIENVIKINDDNQFFVTHNAESIAEISDFTKVNLVPIRTADSLTVLDNHSVLGLSYIKAVSDHLVTSDNVEIKTIGTQQLVDSVTITASADYTDLNALAWVSNLFLLHPIAYDNFPYTSLAQTNDKTLVCGDEGLFELSASDDNGKAINAHIMSGFIDFDSETLKRIPSLYVTNINESGLVIRCETYESGHGSQIYYNEAHPNAAIANTRFKFGKGLQGTHWRFRISNRNGGDFVVYKGQFELAVSKRRLK